MLRYCVGTNTARGTSRSGHGRSLASVSGAGRPCGLGVGGSPGDTPTSTRRVTVHVCVQPEPFARSDQSILRSYPFNVGIICDVLHEADHTRPFVQATAGYYPVPARTSDWRRGGCSATGTCRSNRRESCLLPRPACSRAAERKGENATTHCTMNVAGEVSRNCASCTCPVSADAAPLAN